MEQELDPIEYQPTMPAAKRKRQDDEQATDRKHVAPEGTARTPARLASVVSLEAFQTALDKHHANMDRFLAGLKEASALYGAVVGCHRTPHPWLPTANSCHRREKSPDGDGP
jgi:hypothetical protein